MKMRADVPRVSALFVSIFLAVMLCGVFAAEAQQKNLSEHGEVVMKVPEPIPVGPPVVTKSNRYPNLNERGDVVWQGSDGHDSELFRFSEGTPTKTIREVLVSDPSVGWVPVVGYLQTGGTAGKVYWSPATDSGGTIYVGSDNKNPYAINSDGTQKWVFQTGSPVQSSPAIGWDGTVYVGAGNGKLYAINPDSTLKWAFPTRNSIVSSPVIGSDGTIYIGSYADGRLYAFFEQTSGPATSDWPMFRGNARRTGSAQ